MSRVPLILLVATLGLGAAPAAAQKQGSNPAPREARELVVKVFSRFSGAEGPEVGSGIIIGLDSQRVTIVTAEHVVRLGDPGAVIHVALHGSKAAPVRAIRSDSARADLDIAVLTIPRAALPSGWRPPPFDRLGRVEKLGFGHDVYPMGCPQGECWGAPAPADRIVAVDRQGISFQSAFVHGGSSGGALFNEWWEIVGVVTEDEQPRANAVPIDQVIPLVRRWGYPVSLRRAKVPRAGYALHVGALVMTGFGGGEDSLGAKDRFPSGRIVATRRGNLYGVTWHLSGLRLAPRNLAVTAAMGGLSLNFHYGRFTVQPFAEVGIGRVEGRFDAGGYFVEGGTGYVPFWRQEKQDGLGVGGGLSVQVLVAPHVALEVLGGHWNFRIPEDRTASLPTVFVGSGLRWGI